VRFTITQKRTPERERYLFVDDGLEGYREIIVRRIRHLLPEPGLAITGLPGALTMKTPVTGI